jgi:phage tail sheath gpL-like
MAISFNHIPDNLRLRLYWAEMDPSRAGTFGNNRRILVLGHGTGTAADNTLIRSGSAGSVRARTGRGSMLDRMIVALRGANGFDDAWFIDVPEPSAGTKASGTLEVTAAATAAGVIYLYIAGQKVSVAVAASDTAAQVATKINAAINAAVDLPVTSTVSTATVTMTCRWKGVTGNDIDVRVNYLGSLGNEVLPAGVALTITAMASGAGVPVLDDALAALGDQEFETIVHAWTDSGSLNTFDTAWGHGDDGRWGWLRQLYGHVWSARNGTFGDLSTFGDARNGGEQTTEGMYGSPTPPWERAAIWGGVTHRALMEDPARPLGTLLLPGIKAPAEADRFTKGEQNALLYDGISVADANPDGTMQIQQVVTHYQRNSYGLDDNALLKVNTKATYAYVMRSQRFRITQRFPRHKIANDGTRFGAGQAITTPSGIKAEIYAHYREMEDIGLVENAEQAMRNTIVERDPNNPDRVNTLYSPDFVNQLDVFAVIAQFRLQYAPDLGQQAVPSV